jgi:hypothetical protein
MQHLKKRLPALFLRLGGMNTADQRHDQADNANALR